MEVLTQLRLDLVDELHSLPEVLQSAFPDLAVDFLANVFQDAIGKTVTRIPKSSVSNYKPPETDKPALELPSEEALASSAAVVEALHQEVKMLEAAAAPRPASLGPLTTPVCTTDDAAPNSLVCCKRCKKVMFRSVTATHLAQCREIPPEEDKPVPSGSTMAAPTGSDLTAKTKRGSRANAKRKRSGTSKISKELSRVNTGSVGDAIYWDSAPLSPTLAAVASLRQKRTEGSRTKRKALSFVPGQDVAGPVILNSSPAPRASLGIAPSGPAAVRVHQTMPSHMNESMAPRNMSIPVPSNNAIGLQPGQRVRPPFPLSPQQLAAIRLRQSMVQQQGKQQQQGHMQGQVQGPPQTQQQQQQQRAASMQWFQNHVMTRPQMLPHIMQQMQQQQRAANANGGSSNSEMVANGMPVHGMSPQMQAAAAQRSPARPMMTHPQSQWVLTASPGGGAQPAGPHGQRWPLPQQFPVTGVQYLQTMQQQYNMGITAQQQQHQGRHPVPIELYRQQVVQGVPQQGGDISNGTWPLQHPQPRR